MKYMKILNKYVFPIIIILLLISFIIYASVEKKEGFQSSSPSSCPNGFTVVDGGCVYCPSNFTFDMDLYACKPNTNYNNDVRKLRAPHFCESEFIDSTCPKHTEDGLTYDSFPDPDNINGCIAGLWKCPPNYKIYNNNDLANGVCRRSRNSDDIVILDGENPEHIIQRKLTSTCRSGWRKDTSTGYCFKNKCPASRSTLLPITLTKDCGNDRIYKCPGNSYKYDNKCYKRCHPAFRNSGIACKEILNNPSAPDNTYKADIVNIMCL